MHSRGNRSNCNVVSSGPDPATDKDYFAFFFVCLEISKLFLMLYLTLKSQRFMLKDKSLLLIMVFV